VWLWAGSVDLYSDIAIDLLKTLATLGTNAKWDRSKLPTLSTLYDHAAMQKIGLPLFPSVEWQSIVEFFSRPVFRRIWIIQELVTSRKVFCRCGPKDVIDYKYINKAILFLDLTTWRGPIDTLYASGKNVMSPIPAIEGIQMDWYRRKTDEHRLVHVTARFEASDPRDKVYAIIGLLNDFAHRGAHDFVAPGHQHPHDHEHGVLDGQPNQVIGSDELLALMAEEKYQSGKAPEILRSSLEPRVLSLSTDITNFLSILLDFVKSLWHQFFGFKFTEEDYRNQVDMLQFKFPLDSRFGFNAYREEIDN
jgi:hypothetical protein